MTQLEPTSQEDILRAAHEWRFRLEDPQSTEADRRAFENWRLADPRHSDLYDYAATFHDALGTLRAEDLEQDVRRLTLRERSHSALARLAALSGKSTLATTAAVAALGLFVLGAVMFSGLKTESESLDEAVAPSVYQTRIGEIQRVALADGSDVTLGAASVLETRVSATERRVTLLDGAAFFDVASMPDHPFYVDAAGLTIEVTGTQFEVKRDSTSLRVAVAEGTVEVTFPLMIGNEQTGITSTRALAAGQQVRVTLTGGMEKIGSINPAAVGAWREDKLFYDGAPLSEIVSDANRYSDAKVIIDGDVQTVSSFRVRGSFNARDIDGMLATLPEIYPVDLDRSDPGVIRIISREKTTP